MIDVFIPGIPKAQPRIRRSRSGGVFTPNTAEAWKQAIRTVLKANAPSEPIQGPVCVDLTFLMPRPKRLYRKKDPPGLMFHTVKPDKDNLEKAVLDSAKEKKKVMDAVRSTDIWGDDCQVCDGRTRKFVTAKGGETGVRITIRIPKEEDIPAYEDVANTRKTQ